MNKKRTIEASCRENVSIAWVEHRDSQNSMALQLSVELLSEVELRVLSAFSTLIKNSCGKIKYFFRGLLLFI